MLRKSTSLKILMAGSVAGIAVAAVLSPPTESLALQDSASNYIPAIERGAYTDTPSILATDSADMVSDIIEVAPEPSYKETVEKVKRGDTLAKILSRAGLDSKTRHAVTQALSKVFDPRDLRPGQKITLRFAPEEPDSSTPALERLSLSPKPGIRYFVDRSDESLFEGRVEKETLQTELSRHEGQIRSSLLSAAMEKGVPSQITHNFIKLFSSTVDFSREIRSGDSFELMYERKTDEDGKFVKNGDILFASLTIRGEKIALYRHTDAKGFTDFYDEKGHSVRKSLLRNPVPGSRVSSPYGRRRHPILGYRNMHWGIDYAAPRGTPIHAGGDGVLERVGRKGAYGKYIRLRHNSQYETAYAHMHRYARGMKPGKRVRKGQVIGYVGSTGRSTGPHLHYEIIKSGRRVNPARVKIAAGRILNGKELSRFAQTRRSMKTSYTALASTTAAGKRISVIASAE